MSASLECVWSALHGVRLECAVWSALGVRCLECMGSALPGVRWECGCKYLNEVGVRCKCITGVRCECITGVHLECAAWSALGVRCLECAAWSAFGVRCLERRVEVHPWCILTWKQVSLTWEITKKERTTIDAMTENMPSGLTVSIVKWLVCFNSR